MVRVEHIADAPIEALDAKLLAQQVKLVASAGIALTRGKQAVRELCPVVGQDLCDLDGAGSDGVQSARHLCIQIRG